MGNPVMESLGKRIGLVACLLYFLGLNSFQSPGVEASPAPNPGNNYGDMRSALKFLQDMDSYYGQIARPRKIHRRSVGSEDCPDESGCGPEWKRFVMLQGADDSVSRLSRPRFGKRSDLGQADSDSSQSDSSSRYVMLQGVDDSVSRLSRPRFGKRSDSSQSDSDQRFVMLQGADDSASRLSRPRFGKRSEGLVVLPSQFDQYIYGSPSGGSIDLPKGKYFAIA